MNKFSCTLVGILFWLIPANGQFAPPAGQPGSTAIYKNSPAIVSWANTVIEFKRGASDIANGWSSLASFGDSTEALGYAQGNSTNVVSLGDSGYVTLGFPFPIRNGPGFDFAVFENSFSDDYLEFAFVEVSSDGVNFVRFPAVSLTPVTSQTGSFATSNTVLVNNLAGKYRQGYGTPFDLEELADSANLNLDSIRFVRIVDVIGTVDPAYGSQDSEGNWVNDPYPTDFAAGGFDLDGIGVINENNMYAAVYTNSSAFTIFPNPSAGIVHMSSRVDFEMLYIYDLQGNLVLTEQFDSSGIYDFSGRLNPGIYLLRINESDQFIRLVVQN